MGLKKVKLLTYDEYVANAQFDPQWKSYDKRWVYHQIAIDIASTIDVRKKSEVLEIGAFGNQIVPKSDTMDLMRGGWKIPNFKPTYDYDARSTPWEMIPDKKYKLLIALRVFHHLAPKQEEVFKESMRVAQNIIICCPEKEVVGVGISKQKFYEWYGSEARLTVDTGEWGIVYLF